MTVTLAAIQTEPQPDMERALDHMLPLMQEAADRGATLIATPEYSGGLATDGARVTPPHAEEDGHPVLERLRDFARETGTWTMVGSLAVTGSDGRIANRGFIIDETGAIRSRYDKIHMFDVALSDGEVHRESDTVAPGATGALCDTPAGRIGHTICYDLRFPALYHALAQAGAEILAVPSAFLHKTGSAHWHVLNRARAIETGCFVLAPGAVGSVPGGGRVYGHTLIVDPWGEVLAEGDGDGAAVVMAEIDLDLVAKTRARIPSLSHVRPFAPPA